MGDATLPSVLEQVRAELAAARTRHAILGAEIAGLEARETALIKAMQANDGDDSGRNSAGSHRTDEIVDVLASCGLDMSIKEVIAALGRAGRPNETYDNVSADLAYLAQGKRIRRVQRGVYSDLYVPQQAPDSIVIPLTSGNLNNNHVYLARHISFFPEDALGQNNMQAGTGAEVTLRFDGTGQSMQTDIDPNHKIFRKRSCWREFFQHHRLRPGDQIIIEEMAPYEYRVSPNKR